MISVRDLSTGLTARLGAIETATRQHRRHGAGVSAVGARSDPIGPAGAGRDAAAARTGRRHAARGPDHAARIHARHACARKGHRPGRRPAGGQQRRGAAARRRHDGRRPARAARHGGRAAHQCRTGVAHARPAAGPAGRAARPEPAAVRPRGAHRSDSGSDATATVAAGRGAWHAAARHAGGLHAERRAAPRVPFAARPRSRHAAAADAAGRGPRAVDRRRRVTDAVRERPHGLQRRWPQPLVLPVRAVERTAVAQPAAPGRSAPGRQPSISARSR